MDATLPLLSIAPLVPIASDASQRVCARTNARLCEVRRARFERRRRGGIRGEVSCRPGPGRGRSARERVSFRPHVRGMVPSRAVTVRGRNRISARGLNNIGNTRRARARVRGKIQNACRNDATRAAPHRARSTHARRTGTRRTAPPPAPHAPAAG